MSNKKGLALVVRVSEIDNRPEKALPDYEVDEQNITHTLKEIGYEVEVRENPSAEVRNIIL